MAVAVSSVAMQEHGNALQLPHSHGAVRTPLGWSILQLMKRKRKFAYAGAAALALAGVVTLMLPCDARYNQGCVNQGSDCRKYALVICWMQRHLSWKSEHEPHMLIIGRADRTHLGVAWPPYLVINSPAGRGGWRMFRIGFRYDRNWRGYIFPTVALKRVAEPLRY